MMNFLKFIFLAISAYFALETYEIYKSKNDGPDLRNNNEEMKLK